MRKDNGVKNKITVTGANVFFFIFTLLFIVFQIILIFLTALFGEDFLDNNIYNILLVNEYILILIPTVLYILVKRYSFKEVFRFNKLEPIQALLIVLMSVPAYIVALMLNNIVVFFLQFIGDVPGQPIPVPKNFQELVVGILIVAVSPAICEEMLHRGVLLKAYENRGSMKAVVITSVFFGIFHYDVTNFLGPVFLGLLMGYFVIRTNSIFAGMLAHFLNNTIAELLQFFNPENEPAVKKITVSFVEMGYILLYGFAGAVLLWGLLKLFGNITNGRAILRSPISSIKNDIISVISHWPVIVVSALYVFMAGLYILSIVISKAAGITY